MFVRSNGSNIALWNHPFGGADLLEGVVENFLNLSRNTIEGPHFSFHEDERGALLEAPLPGLVESDIDVSIDKSTLKIEARQEIGHPDGYRFVVRERTATNFKYSFTLSDDFDSTGIEAKLEDGFLRVRIPRRPETKPIQVPVTAKTT